MAMSMVFLPCVMAQKKSASCMGCYSLLTKAESIIVRHSHGVQHGQQAAAACIWPMLASQHARGLPTCHARSLLLYRQRQLLQTKTANVPGSCLESILINSKVTCKTIVIAPELA